jgi:DNA-binding MarR family transcriptional regulator
MIATATTFGDTGGMNTPVKLDRLHNSVWRLFLTANVKVLERIEAELTQAQLPPLEWYDVLLTLKEAPNHRLRLSELADHVLLSRSNLTRLVDRLEKVGLLHREPCPDDRRGTFAVLSHAGLAMQAAMWSVYAAGIATHFADQLEEDEVEVLQRVLQRLLAAIDHQADAVSG